MTMRLTNADHDFSAKLAALLNSRNVGVADVASVVKDIIAKVQAHGDQALLDYTQTFDRVTLASLRLSEAQVEAAATACAPEVRAALTLAAERIRAYHAVQKPTNHQYVDAAGVTLGWQYAPLSSVGIYVPGGKASYPSSVPMNAIPAQVAGVERIVMVVPTPDGILNTAVLVAAQLSRVGEARLHQHEIVEAHHHHRARGGTHVAGVAGVHEHESRGARQPGRLGHRS